MKQITPHTTPRWWIFLGSLLILFSGMVCVYFLLPKLTTVLTPTTPKLDLNTQMLLDTEQKIIRRLQSRRDNLLQHVSNFQCTSQEPSSQVMPPAVLSNGMSTTQRQNLLTKLKKSVVLIITDEGTGTGFFIDKTHIITNEHVINKARTVAIYNEDILSTPITGTVISSEKGSQHGRDYALIKVDTVNQAEPLSYTTTAKTLDYVAAAGYPGIYQGLADNNKPRLIIRSGEMIDYFNQSSGLDLVSHTAEIFPGNSGGPLVDRCGRVIGVNTFIQWTSIDKSEQNSPVEKFNFALRANDLQRYLQSKDITLQLDDSVCSTK